VARKRQKCIIARGSAAASAASSAAAAARMHTTWLHPGGKVKVLEIGKPAAKLPEG